VWRAVDEAARRADQLEADGRELDFRVDELTGCLAIELRDLAGTVLSELSIGDAMAIAEGGPAA
jgi:hypothetical protein